jgi:hypothetical protein
VTAEGPDGRPTADGPDRGADRDGAADLRHAAARAAELLAGLAARVHDALPALAGVAVDVGEAWPDALGREWTERAAMVHRALARDLDALLDGVRAAEGIGHPALPATRTLNRGAGPQLGTTDADRTDDDRGMRLPALDGPS